MSRKLINKIEQNRIFGFAVTWMRAVKWKFLHTFFLDYAVRLSYKNVFGKELDLENPQTINEKLQYLKLNDYRHNPDVSLCADKYRIREYVTSRGMGGLFPELYAVYDSPTDIDWDTLPDQFAMKCNHGCGYNILCSDKSRLDVNQAAGQMKKWFRTDYWRKFGEIHYRPIEKKIIVEEYLGSEIATYKFYCFHGEPKLLYISYNGEDGEKDKYVTYYDLDLKELPYELMPHERKHGDIEKPENFAVMEEYAQKLSREFPFVRVDLYNVRGRIYLSELTFFPTGGFMRLKPQGSDMEWGNWLKLDKSLEIKRE